MNSNKRLSVADLPLTFNIKDNNYNQTIGNGADIDIGAYTTVNKKDCRVGEYVTYTLTITNNGDSPADINVYNVYNNRYSVDTHGFEFPDYDKIIPVPNLEPGESFKKSFTLQASDRGWHRSSMHSYVSVGGKIIGAVTYPYVRKGSDISLIQPASLIYGEKLDLSGSHSYNIQSVDIVAPDGEVLETINNCTDKSYFSVKLDIPEKYCPNETEETKSLTLKAVATDTDGKTSSSSVTFDIIRYNNNNSFYIEDCHYLSYGNGTFFDRETAAIMYSGNRMIIRAKFGGVAPEDVTSATVTIETGASTKEYNMVRYNSGRYKGYFGVLVDGITDSDKFEIRLNASETSGLTVDRLIGFGRILIDPSGIITDPEGNPIEGVKVTLQKLADDGETWVDWDAENYMQSNPVYTNNIGYYGWDVVEGTYRIIAEKEGYKTKTVEEYFSRD